MKRSNVKILIIALLTAVFCAALFAACVKYKPYEDIPGIGENAVMSIEYNRVNFALGMEIDEQDIIERCGIVLKDNDKEVKVTKELIAGGAIKYDSFDLNTSGTDRRIEITHKNSSNYIFYDVNEYKAEFYLDKGQTELWKSVDVKDYATFSEDMELCFNVSANAFNYSLDETARSQDAQRAERFNGWHTEDNKLITGMRELSAFTGEEERTLKAHAEFLTDEEFSAMNLSYDDRGRRVFAGYSGEQVDVLNIPEGVTYIDLFGIFNNTPEPTDINFSELHIPSTANLDLPLQSRINTVGLNSITVDGGNQNYSDFFGALYSKNYDTLYLMPASSETMDYPEEVTTFARYSCAFWETRIVNLPESVNTLMDYCFAYSNIIQVNGLDRVENRMTGILWESQFPVIIENGATYTQDVDGKFSLSRVIDKDMTSFTVKEGTKQIVGEAFKECSQLISVNLGNSLEFLGESAFSGCTSLKSITLPSTIKNMGESVFYGCTALTTVNGFENITFSEEENAKYVIPAYTFYNCTALESVKLPSKLTQIGAYAFGNCSGLTSVSLPDGVKILGTGAFRNCGFTSIKLPSQLRRLGNNCFVKCKLTEIDLSVCPYLTELSKECFMESRLVSVTIPDSITVLPEKCFYNIPTLESVNLGKVTEIGIRAFSYCTHLKTIEWGKNVETIKERAFTNCYALQTIVLPDSVRTVGSYVFQRCDGLEELTLGKNVETFGTYTYLSDGITFNAAYLALWQCYNVKRIEVAAGNENFRSVDGILYGKLVCGQNYGECGVLYSVPAAYDGGEQLTLPQSVKVILPYAFQYQKGINSVILNEGLENIGKAAFYMSEGLQSLAVPASVKNIGANILLSCPNMQSITIASGNQRYKSKDDLIYDGNTIILSSGINADVVIDEGDTIFTGAFMNNLTVTSVTLNSIKNVESNAFKGCNNIVSITIGDNLETLDTTAFSALPKLKSITVSPNNKYFKSVDDILYSKDGKKLLLCPAAKVINDLQSIEGVTEIGDWAFAYNNSLKSAILPKGVKKIGDYAFYECRGIEVFFGSETLESIGQYAFSFATKLTTSATDTRHCDTLKTVLLYGEMKTLGANAFYGQYGIQSVYFYMTEAELNNFMTRNHGVTNMAFLTYGCQNASTGKYYNNDGKGINRYLYSRTESDLPAPNGYSWFHMDENGLPVPW